jgi:hypothetical protein
MRALLGALGIVLVLTGCGGEATVQVAAPLPERVVPATLGGFTTAPEPSADKAFASAGKGSLTAHGAVWTLRQDGEVRGALQVGVLKPRFDTDDIDVRRGVRANIETGQYRWFKVTGQWVGVQELPELRLYLWFPPRSDVYEVLQLQPDVPAQKQLLESIISYQKGSA